MVPPTVGMSSYIREQSQDNLPDRSADSLDPDNTSLRLPSPFRLCHFDNLPITEGDEKEFMGEGFFCIRSQSLFYTSAFRFKDLV